MNETELRKRWRAELNGCELIEAMTPNIIAAATCAWLNCIHNGGPYSKKQKAQYWKGMIQGIFETLQMLGLTNEEIKEIEETVDIAAKLYLEKEREEENEP